MLEENLNTRKRLPKRKIITEVLGCLKAKELDICSFKVPYSSLVLLKTLLQSTIWPYKNVLKWYDKASEDVVIDPLTTTCPISWFLAFCDIM